MNNSNKLAAALVKVALPSAAVAGALVGAGLAVRSHSSASRRQAQIQPAPAPAPLAEGTSADSFALELDRLGGDQRREPGRGRTGLAGGAVPSQGAVLLSLAGLDRIEEIDTASGLMVVGAGCIQHLGNGTSTPVRHWVEVLDEALAPPGGAV